MIRPCLLAILTLGLAATAPAQGPAAGPKIDLQASGAGTGSGAGSATASGKITLTAPWQLSIHVVTIRHQKDGGTKTLNAFVPVKGDKFTTDIGLKTGSYKVWAVIDIKDAEGHEKQISSDPQSVSIP
jgi:hypothetical protein